MVDMRMNADLRNTISFFGYEYCEFVLRISCCSIFDAITFQIQIVDTSDCYPKFTQFSFYLYFSLKLVENLHIQYHFCKQISLSCVFMQLMHNPWEIKNSQININRVNPDFIVLFIIRKIHL